MSPQPDKVTSRVPLTDKSGRKILDQNNKAIMTREYHYKTPNGEKIIFQEHSLGHTYGPKGTAGNQGPHFNPRQYDPATGNGYRNKSFPGISEHYNYGNSKL